MFKRVLVPLDGSKLADRILAQVSRLLKSEDAEVMLLRVLSGTVEGEEDRIWLDDEETPRNHLDRLKTHLTDEGASVDYVFRSGEPAEEILNFAEEYDPSLIAMSTHGRTGLDRFTHGSVAERVLRRSRHPLLLANPKTLEKEVKEARFHKILVPLDGSETSALVLPMVEELARIYASEVVLLHAVPMYPDPASAVKYSPEIAQAAVAPYQERLESLSIPVRVLVPYGIISQEIIAAVREEKPDLLAITTHGRSGISRWVFGSIAETVIRNCACPLLVKRTAGFAQSRGDNLT